MSDLQTMLAELLAWVRTHLGPTERALILALAVAAAFHAGVWLLERLTGTRGDEYRSRDYAHDLAYWFYYRSGINYFLIISLVYPGLDHPLPWIDLGLLTPYPIWLQALVFFLVSDLYAYCTHRTMHRFRVLWSFHAMHHAPERITYASSARFHPVEIFVIYSGFYLLVRISGSNPLAWLPVMVFMEVMLQAQHTRIPWRLGPLYKVFVTPTFHRFHHSDDPAHYNHNFGAVLSVWDHLFGTALKQQAPWPERLGVRDVRHDTLLDTLLQPFAAAVAPLLRRRSRGPEAIARPATSEPPP